jgi:hypothetical protein
MHDRVLGPLASSMDEMQRKMEKVAALPLAPASSSIQANTVPAGPYFDWPFRANGGPAVAGSPLIVGEGGWEIFVPPMDGEILDHSRSRDLLALLQAGAVDGNGASTDQSRSFINYGTVNVDRRAERTLDTDLLFMRLRG